MLPHALHRLSFVERFYSHLKAISTNDIARAMKEFPNKGLFVVQADRQTAGRGRSGASFFSDHEGGLWASIITPIASLNEHFMHNRALSVAICEAVEASCGPGHHRCTIKWPNDIYWNDRKLCGILLENHPGRADMLVIGFGINVAIKTADFPAELQAIATSLLIETGKTVSPATLLENILQRYNTNLANDISKTHETYSERLYGVDRTAEIEGNCGLFTGVEIDGRLRLKTGQEVLFFLSGHLRFPKDGP